MDVVFGDTTGSHGESGWVQGLWTRKTGTKVNVCLNSALQVAERDLFLGGGSAIDGDEGVKLTTAEAVDTQALLAETIREMYPDMEVSSNQQTIITFNDAIAADGETRASEQMEAVLRKCEDKAWDKWLEDHPEFDPQAPSQAFIDYAVEGGVS
jgi:hypothetical protein